MERPNAAHANIGVRGANTTQADSRQVAWAKLARSHAFDLVRRLHRMRELQGEWEAVYRSDQLTTMAALERIEADAKALREALGGNALNLVVAATSLRLHAEAALFAAHAGDWLTTPTLADALPEWPANYFVVPSDKHLARLEAAARRVREHARAGHFELAVFGEPTLAAPVRKSAVCAALDVTEWKSAAPKLKKCGVRYECLKNNQQLVRIDSHTLGGLDQDAREAIRRALWPGA